MTTMMIMTIDDDNNADGDGTSYGVGDGVVNDDNKEDGDGDDGDDGNDDGRDDDDDDDDYANSDLFASGNDGNDE